MRENKKQCLSVSTWGWQSGEAVCRPVLILRTLLGPYVPSCSFIPKPCWLPDPPDFIWNYANMRCWLFRHMWRPGLRCVRCFMSTAEKEKKKEKSFCNDILNCQYWYCGLFLDDLELIFCILCVVICWFYFIYFSGGVAPVSAGSVWLGSLESEICWDMYLLLYLCEFGWVSSVYFCMEEKQSFPAL